VLAAEAGSFGLFDSAGAGFEGTAAFAILWFRRTSFSRSNFPSDRSALRSSGIALASGFELKIAAQAQPRPKATTSAPPINDDRTVTDARILLRFSPSLPIPSLPIPSLPIPSLPIDLLTILLASST